MTVGDEAPQDEQAQAARAAAEARRRRILESRSERLGVVAGGGTTKSPQEEQDESSGKKEPTGTTSRGMQVMRQRRKRQQQKKQLEEMKAETTTSEPKEEQDSPNEESETKPSTTTEKDTTSSTTETPASSEQPTRKYQGVARMRRKMIKEKQAAAAATKEPTSGVTTTMPLQQPLPTKIPIFFIVVNLLTITILFGAGLQIGLQHEPSQVLTIHRSLSMPQNGIGILQYQSSKGVTDLKDLFAGASHSTDNEMQEDEFAQDKDDSETKTPNVDPLFRVDLDELTRGDTFFFKLARFAVRMHRINLWVFYEFPKSIFTSVLQIPSLLLSNPPILCLLALCIRQASQYVTGGDLELKEEKKSKDLLTMAKNMVMQFLSEQFPMVVGLYKVWTHLRADLYILLCGFFVGVACLHSFANEEAWMMDNVIAEEPMEDSMPETVASKGLDEL